MIVTGMTVELLLLLAHSTGSRWYVHMAFAEGEWTATLRDESGAEAVMSADDLRPVMGRGHNADTALNDLNQKAALAVACFHDE